VPKVRGAWRRVLLVHDAQNGRDPVIGLCFYEVECYHNVGARSSQTI